MVFNSLWEDPGVGDTAVVVCGQLAFFPMSLQKRAWSHLPNFLHICWEMCKTVIVSSGKITDFLLPYSGNFCGRKLLQSGEKRRFLWIAQWCHQIMPCPQISRRICHTESNRSWMGAGIVAINCNLWSLITLVSSPDLIRTGVGFGSGTETMITLVARDLLFG